ncbi:MAG: GNAT family N-acetyltransferase [Lentisphaeria bacterium]|nr:GNAT family N-acetyltransferase [Lentisphaeria bacterium]
MNNDIILRPVQKDEYGKVRELAETVWPVCYKDILSVEQIAYMMDMMYSGEVISGEVSAGVHYCFVESAGAIAGYLAWGECDPVRKVAKLHKLYLLPEKQEQGIGSAAVKLVKQAAKGAGFNYLRLNVNRQNANAIKCYTANGFTMVHQEDNDIGNGFFMTDYVMEAEI